MERLIITKEQVKPLFESKFVKVNDLNYREGKHYYVATRKNAEELTALMTDEEFRKMLPDAVTLCVILRMEDADRLLTFYEYRYPTGRFLLSPPAGLIDEQDRAKDPEEAIYLTAVRELFEETGLIFKETDTFRVLNPCVFSSPGFTDESNAVALLVLENPDVSVLTDKNTEGAEFFNGFRLLDREEALERIRSGRDELGNTYSVYTWQALLYFVSDLWK